MEHSRISHIFNRHKIRKPSDKCFMIALPMFMHRIETCAFKVGLNFFQKTVLMLKFHPEVDNHAIAELINIDESLVKRIEDELIHKELLYPQNGKVNEKGKQALENIDELLFDDNDRQLGYIFSYDDGNTFFPNYQNCNSLTTVLPNDKIIESNDPFLIKDDEVDNPSRPSEQLILNFIKRYYGNASEESKVNTDNLKVKFISKDDKADKVIVYTYVFLEKDEETGLYSNDWYVLDPFTGEKSPALQFYLKKTKERQMANILDEKFADALTTDDQRFAEVNEWINNMIEERINVDFGKSNFNKLSLNIQSYITSIIDSFIRSSKSDAAIKQDYLQLIYSNFQKAIEAILLNDQKTRSDAYDSLECNFGDSTGEERKSFIKEIFKLLILSDSHMVPKVYFNPKYLSNNWNTSSLKTYLLKFIMSIGFDSPTNSARLIPVFKNRIDRLIEIANARNGLEHADSNDETPENISFDELSDVYSFIKDFINDYIKSL